MKTNNKLDVIASQIETMDSEEQVVVIGGKGTVRKDNDKDGDNTFICIDNGYCPKSDK